MKFVALVSGGKDSIYSILECVRNGHELVACVHLGAPTHGITEESFMYQTAASEVIPTLVEECLGVPLVLYHRKGTSENTSLVYQTVSEKDEVEDLFQALQEAKERFPEITAVSSGAILSTYQRVRIENVCSRLNLTSLSYLWRADSQEGLLKRMLHDGISAVLVKVACPPGLVPGKHLNQTLDRLYYSGLFETLHEKYKFHMCGEGGEYESLVVDCPLYKKRLVLDDVQVLEANDDGVGELVIKTCHAELKEDQQIMVLTVDEKTDVSAARTSETQPSSPSTTPFIGYMPYVCQKAGGLLHVSEIMSPLPAVPNNDEQEADLAIQEALSIFELLGLSLHRHEATPRDVLLVHLYLSEISHFAGINAHYREFFGTQLPPSRSCVAVGRRALPGGRRVLLDCIVQLGSSSYMRGTTVDDNAYARATSVTKTSSLREVLHVQSISYWAPVCVGPYSQVNTLRSGLHFLAGQIGLVPETMRLRKTWTSQLEQCWTNVARVLDALDGGSLDHILSCLVYVSSSVISTSEASWKAAKAITSRQIQANGYVKTGAIDDMDIGRAFFGGYEDEETWRELSEGDALDESSSPSILFVAIPEMPMGALAEVEVICASRRAVSGLSLSSSELKARGTIPCNDAGIAWDTGHDFASKMDGADDKLSITSSILSLGEGCAAVATIAASVQTQASNVNKRPSYLNPESVLYDMLATMDDAKSSAGLCLKDALHVRLYFHATCSEESSMNLNDGIRLRSALASALASVIRKDATERPASIPASSVVPVHDMQVLHSRKAIDDGNSAVFAMHILMVDAAHMETEIWVHCGRAN